MCEDMNNCLKEEQSYRLPIGKPILLLSDFHCVFPSGAEVSATQVNSELIIRLLCLMQATKYWRNPDNLICWGGHFHRQWEKTFKCMVIWETRKLVEWWDSCRRRWLEDKSSICGALRRSRPPDNTWHPVFHWSVHTYIHTYFIYGFQNLKEWRVLFLVKQ